MDDSRTNPYRLFRIARDIPVKTLAGKLGVTPAYVSAIEAGKRRPSTELLPAYAAALGTDPGTLLRFADPASRPDTFEKCLMAVLETIVGNPGQEEPEDPEDPVDALGRLMVRHGACIRAVPETVRGIFEKYHADDPKMNGPDVVRKKIAYLDEYKREMLVTESVPHHAGMFLVETGLGTSAQVRFSGRNWYPTLRDAVRALADGDRS